MKAGLIFTPQQLDEANNIHSMGDDWISKICSFNNMDLGHFSDPLQVRSQLPVHIEEEQSTWATCSLRGQECIPAPKNLIVRFILLNNKKDISSLLSPKNSG